MSKCFDVFLLCFAWLGFLFCCLGRAVGSVVRYLGAISAEVDVKFFLFFFKPVVSLPGSVWPHRWLCWQEAEGTAGQGRGTGTAPAHLAPASLALLRLHWNTVSDTLEQGGRCSSALS